MRAANGEHEEMMIRELAPTDIAGVKSFTDRWIGENYYSNEELQESLEFSKKNNLNASLVAVEGDKIVGVRLTYAPGAWTKKARGITPAGWKVAQNEVAYFKSLFIHEEFQKMGIGRRLSSQSIEILKQMGARAIICHSWLESPGNSSQKYLQKMGFEEVARHEKFWYPIDYQCTRCGPARCVCTAVEMIKYL